MKRLRRYLFSVRVRVGLVATIAVGTTLVIGGVVLINLLHRNVFHSFRSQAQLEAAAISQGAAHGPLPNPLPAVDVANLTVIQVVDSGGRVISASPTLSGRPPIMNVRSTRRIQQTALDHPTFASSQRFTVFAVPVTINGEPATVIMASSLADLEHSVDGLGKFMLIALPVLLALVATSSRVIIGRSLRPVEAMRAEVAEITNSQLNRRVPEPESDDEVNRLAVTLNQMLDRLQGSSDRQQRFVADASHELRSPIANIKAALEVALRRPNSADWPAVAGDVLGQDERMASLVDELLLLARFDEVLGTPHLSPVDVSDIVSRQPDQAAAPIAVDVVAAEPAIVLADRGHLERVISNLVDNARRHASTRVELSVDMSGDWVQVRVRDDGPGIPEADRSHIFERFVRLEEDRARASGGFGLGLAIVKELVGLYGGTIEVGEAQPGAVFIVRLPRDRAAGNQSMVTPEEQPKATLM
jgi:signal transduction histidine kinase